MREGGRQGERRQRLPLALLRSKPDPPRPARLQHPHPWRTLTPTRERDTLRGWGEASQTQSIDTRTRSTQSLGRADAHTQVHAVIPKVPRGKPQSPGLPPPPRPPVRSSHPLLLPLTANATGQSRPDPAGQQSQRGRPGRLDSAGPVCARVPGSRVLRPAARSGELSFAATPRLGPCTGGSRLACGAVPGLPRLRTREH